MFFLFSIATSALAYADVIILRLVSSDTEIAEYSVALRLANFLVFGTVAINVVIGPRIASAYRAGETRSLTALATRSARYGTLFSVGIGLPLFALAEPVLGLFGEQYIAGAAALRVIILAQILSASFGPVNQICLFTGSANVSTAVIALAVIVNSVANFFLAPRFGSTGAAFALLLSFAVWNVLLFSFLKLRHGVNASVL